MALPPKRDERAGSPTGYDGELVAAKILSSNIAGPLRDYSGAQQNETDNDK